VGSENAAGSGNGHFDAITQKLWQYFGDYLQFWLTQTGYPDNPTSATIDSSAGVDGLRGDFGQGLPPPCWEYIINRTRARKWNFVFMAESLDGGPVTYRSGRHFDILNENIFRDLRSAQTASQFRGVYAARAQAYGHAPVLLNTSSHDEDNFKDPFQGVVRFAINSAMYGVPLISAGQELGLTGTIVPPNNDSDPSVGPPFGYDLYFSPFDPKKRIPQFMEFNSIMPLWRALASGTDPTPEVNNLYSMIGNARNSSPALRSEQSVLLNLQNGQPFDQIFSVAKFQRRNVSAASNDVVFAFVNLSVGSDAETTAGNWFNVNIDQDHDGTNDFGIRPERLYNVKNMAAYTGNDPNRRNAWLWGTGRTGSDLLTNGVFVHLNRVPASHDGWASAPYEAQFLKLVDVTPAGAAPAHR
jgi:glycosidase